MNNIDRLHKDLIAGIITELFNKDGARFLLNNSDTWNKPLPEMIANTVGLMIEVSNWSLEESYLTDNGVFIKCSFDEDEYSKEFIFDDIIMIMSLENEEPCYEKIRVFNEPVTEYSLLGLMKD